MPFKNLVWSNLIGYGLKNLLPNPSSYSCNVVSSTESMVQRADCREQEARGSIYLLNLISSLLLLPWCFLNLVGSQASRLLMRGGVVSLGSDWDCDEVPCLDALPLNRTLHIRLSTFTYSSFIFKTSFVRIDPMSASGTLKKGRLSCSLRSCSFSDRACAMKLTCLPA